jgi:predicted nucleotidyltransferase
MKMAIDFFELLKIYFQSTETVLFAFLFGSQASGKIYQESDVDVAVYLKEGYSLSTVKKIWTDIEAIVKKDIDLIILNTAPPLIAHAALRGKPIVIKEQALFLNYLLQTSGEAEDFSLFLQDMWQWREKIKAERLTHGTP